MDQKGVTMVEQALAALFVGFLMLVWINSIRVTSKGTIQSKNNLRAQNLAMSKLEDVKNTAIQSSHGNSWSSVTQSALIEAYRTPQVSQIESKAFTWRVLSDYAVLGLSTTPNIVTNTTGTLWIRAEVQWQDVTGPKFLTMTGYSTNYRQ